jgi:hypothetical protein
MLQPFISGALPIERRSREMTLCKLALGSSGSDFY